jgi:hypothetical protein
MQLTLGRRSKVANRESKAMKAGEPLEGRLLYPVYGRQPHRDTGGHRSSRQCNSTRFRPKPPDPLAPQGRFHTVSYPGCAIDQLILPDGTRRPIVSGSSRNVAAGIGIYGAALSFYDLWLARGHDVVFAKNTRIEVTTTPGRNQLESPEVKEKASPSR